MSKENVGNCSIIINEFLVSKETVVLRWWERSKQKFGFIKRVDKTKALLLLICLLRNCRMEC